MGRRDAGEIPALITRRTLLSRCCPTTVFCNRSRGRQSGKYLMLLAPRAGFEPATNRLTAGCSTTELPGNGARSDPRITKQPDFA